ncbi:hypothetical protein SDC9_89524 [bioreactor metagenome]|uniref:Uncharacterized protein n=1 Tax=bioreactor metagenome TaxID=1076179 RepID=A0A644ZPS7_9ZZZZ
MHRGREAEGQRRHGISGDGLAVAVATARTVGEGGGQDVFALGGKSNAAAVVG